MILVKGVGTLVARWRGYERARLQPLTVGGGQQRGLRPATLPVAPIAALGEAAELAVRDPARRRAACRAARERTLAALLPLGVRPSGDQSLVADHVLNLAFPGLDSDALMVALKVQGVSLGLPIQG